jgi:hypothetical protein
MKKPVFVIVSQVYVPDPAAVGQYVADVAAEMVRRGYRTIVYTSARGYDDPSKAYLARETRDGVEVRRLPFSSFGKSSIAVRLAAQCLFLVQAVVRGLFTPGLCGLIEKVWPWFGPMAEPKGAEGTGGFPPQALQPAAPFVVAIDQPQRATQEFG